MPPSVLPPIFLSRPPCSRLYAWLSTLLWFWTSGISIVTSLEIGPTHRHAVATGDETVAIKFHHVKGVVLRRHGQRLGARPIERRGRIRERCQSALADGWRRHGNHRI